MPKIEFPVEIKSRKSGEGYVLLFINLPAREIKFANQNTSKKNRLKEGKMVRVRLEW